MISVILNIIFFNLNINIFSTILIVHVHVNKTCFSAHAHVWVHVCDVTRFDSRVTSCSLSVIFQQRFAVICFCLRLPHRVASPPASPPRSGRCARASSRRQVLTITTITDRCTTHWRARYTPHQVSPYTCRSTPLTTHRMICPINVLCIFSSYIQCASCGFGLDFWCFILNFQNHH